MDDFSRMPLAVILPLYALAGGVVGVMLPGATEAAFAWAVRHGCWFLPFALVAPSLMTIMTGWALAGWRPSITTVLIGSLLATICCPLANELVAYAGFRPPPDMDFHWRALVWLWLVIVTPACYKAALVYARR